MEYIFFGAVTVFLSLWGFVDLIRFLLFHFFRSENDSSIIIVSPIGKDTQDAEFILRSCCEKVKWMGKARPNKVICLDTGMNSELQSICTMVEKDYGFLETLTIDELMKLLLTDTK